jgi:hypothetical protein
LGDTTQSFFFTPATKPGEVIAAIGPVAYFPTATDHRIGGGKWGAGVTGLVLKQAGAYTFGALSNQIRSIAGDDNRPEFSILFMQPFSSHSGKRGLTIGVNSDATCDWKRDQWTMPLSLTVTQLTVIGERPVSIGGGLRY